MNIIFDLAGVVLNWKPKEVISKITTSHEEIIDIEDCLIYTSDWINLDKGTITWDEVLINSKQRASIVTPQKIKAFYELIPLELTPVNEMISLIKELYKNGHNLYVLSNMHKYFADYLKANYDFWKYFKDVLYSCDIQMVKPNANIFEFILNKNNLKSNETIFIDDTLENVDAAKNLNIDGIHFKSKKLLVKDLEERGVVFG